METSKQLILNYRDKIRDIERQICNVKIQYLQEHCKYKRGDIVCYRIPGNFTSMVGTIEHWKIDDKLETIKYNIRRLKKNGSPLDRVVCHPVDVAEEYIIGIFNKEVK